MLQPGPYDGGLDPDDAIGTLFDFEPIVFRGNANNVIDAAIALSSTDLLGYETLWDGYGPPKSTTVAAFVGQAVQKYGRTTELTTGVVDAINATVRVGYSSGTARFVDQIIVTPGTFGTGGDSGSLVVVKEGEDDRSPVGLLFAGSSSHIVCNPIGAVLQRFGVTVDDGTAEPPNDPPLVAIISPEDTSTFDSGAEITFQGAATDNEDGDLSADLEWTSSINGPIGLGATFSSTLSDGTHTITASVTDLGGRTGSDSISITVGTPPAEAQVSVASIEYATQGGSDSTKHLLITVALVDDFGIPVPDGFVEITLDNTTTGQSWFGSGITGDDGTVTFTLNNAPSGTYRTTVTAVTATGLTWDGFTPENSFTK